MLEVSHLHAGYGDVVAVRDVSFRVDEGEIVALVGSNGAGKTTTLKAISQVVPPRRGEITFRGRRIDRLPSHAIVELGLIHVPEGRKLFPHMTVQENLQLGSYTQLARRARASTLARVYALFPILAERRNQAAGTLSGGEQQMCAIGRGLMGLPRLLMLDEPSLGLAPIIVLQILEVIREINRQGITVLLVEQNVQHSLKLSHRAYVMENGSLVLDGRGEELLASDEMRRAYLGL